MSDHRSTPTRRSVLRATGAAVTTTGLTGVASAVTDPSNVEADRVYTYRSYGFDNSNFDHALVRVYQADWASESDVESVGGDIADMLSDFSALNGYKVEVYTTNMTGLENCMDTSGCDPYQTCRDTVVELGHHTDGGGNIFIHDGDGGGTYPALNHDNYITMPYYNSDNLAPISIKIPDTLSGKNGDVHWFAAHEVAHQLHGDPDNWSSDYGTYYCGSCDPQFDIYEDCGRKSHHLTNVRSDNVVTVMSAPNRGGQWACGDCSNTYDDQYASVTPSSCLDDATADAIEYAKNNL